MSNGKKGLVWECCILYVTDHYKYATDNYKDTLAHVYFKLILMPQCHSGFSVPGQPSSQHHGGRLHPASRVGVTVEF